MPHLELHGQELDNAYPSLSVPQDGLLPDAANDEDDMVYQWASERQKRSDARLLITVGDTE